MPVAPCEPEQRFEHLGVMLVVGQKLRRRADDERAHARVAQKVAGTLVDEHHGILDSVSGLPFTLSSKLTTGERLAYR